MSLDLDTFLVALYTTVDDLYQAEFALLKPNRPGPDPRLTDSEVLTIALCGQWFSPSEQALIRYAREHWRSYFPEMLTQSRMNRRIRDLAGVLVHLIPLVAVQLRAELAPYQAFDCLPVPLMRKCRGSKHRLFADEADVGKGGADKDFYYGCQVLLAVTPDGVITGFLIGPARTEGHWMAEGFLCWRNDPYGTPWKPEDLPHSNKRDGSDYVGPTGPIWPKDAVGHPITEPYIGDGGFRGPLWTAHWSADYRAVVFTTFSYRGENAQAAQAQHRGWRHVVETVNSHLENVFHLPFPLARTRWGLLTRVAAKLAAFNLGIWINRLFGREDFALATLFSH